MRNLILVLLIGLGYLNISAQDIELSIQKISEEKANLLEQIASLDTKIEELKLKKIISDLKAIGLPSEDYIEHSGMILQYSEQHEQARWVAHMILPDIEKGSVYRTNDFREDPKVVTGTANETDFFLTETLSSGKKKYDGFGYDRGHLAPSADFRWSQTAVSESYFYSNMSPQLPEFNREIWAELENHLRQYVIANKVELYVITAPVLKAGLDTITRAQSHISIPEEFVKIAYDPVNKRGIGFVFSHSSSDYPLETFAVNIDKVEEILDLDLFSSLPEDLEKNLDKDKWFAELENGDVEPIYQPSMPRHHFNTIVGSKKLGQKVTVCGKVVASRHSRKGHLWLNLDKHFPHQLFSVFVRKQNLIQFDSEIKDLFLNQNVCVTGKVERFSNDNPPLIEIKNSKSIKLYQSKNSKVE